MDGIVLVKNVKKMFSTIITELKCIDVIIREDEKRIKKVGLIIEKKWGITGYIKELRGELTRQKHLKSVLYVENLLQE